MKTIYLDCSMGAAGDMLMGALYELLPDQPAFTARMASLGLPGIALHVGPRIKCGITGTHMQVLVHGESEDGTHCHTHDEIASHAEHPHHHHTGLSEIAELISRLELPQSVREDALAVYRSIADAESRVHGVPVTDIHFHEVGTLDALADVVGVCLLFSMLQPEQILCSPVCVGSGQVACAHGVLPIPTPATALLLTGIPIYAGSIRGELCTPTGAALLRHFVTSFCPMPVFIPEAVGYGMGTRDFPAANCVRAMLGRVTA